MANEYNDKSPNTQGRLMRRFGDDKAKFAIKIDYWKDSMKISFCPRLNEKTEYGEYKYAFDVFNDDFKKDGISILLRASECMTLYDDIMNYIVPCINGDKEPKVVGISKGDNLFTITPNKDSNGQCHPKIILYSKINPETMTCDESNIFEFEFNTSTAIMDYDYNNGSYTTEIKHGEFMIFVSDLKCLVEGTSMAYVHAASTANKWYNDMIKERLNAIAEKNGIQVGYRRGFNGAGGKGDIFSSKGNNQDMIQNDEVVGSITDLPFN